MANIDKQTINKIIDDPYNFVNSLSVTKIVNILKYLSETYYNTNKSLVSDNVYDIIRDVLREKNPKHKFLQEVGAPISKNKVKLPYHMASLDKIKPDTKLLDLWTKHYKGNYVLSDKLDGVSGLLYKSNNKLYLYTRGDGAFGQNISHLIQYVINIKVDIPENTAIRGELIISKTNFNKIKDTMANARNAVAGLVNAKHYSVDIAKITDFVAYSIMYPRYKHDKQMELMKTYKLNVVDYSMVTELTNNMISDKLINRRQHGNYDIDGIVVSDSHKCYELGDSNPKHSFAFKQVLTDQIAEVVVLDVLWAVSKDGYIKPRIKIEPINLNGVTITYATAYNAK